MIIQEAERQRKKEDALKAAEDREKEAFDMAERAKAAMVQAEQQRAEEVRCVYASVWNLIDPHLPYEQD